MQLLPNSQPFTKKTPLLTAAHIACLEVVEILVEHRVAVTRTDEMRVPNGARTGTSFTSSSGPVVLAAHARYIARV